MSIFRNTVWFLKGMREYTASGYAAASSSFNQKDLDVSCEVILAGCIYTNDICSYHFRVDLT